MGSAKNYDLTVYPIQVAVRSASDGAAVHMVTLPHCDCADFTNRRGRLIEAEGTGPSHVSVCKHIAAALERVGGWHRGEPEPLVFADQTRQQARTVLLGAGQPSRFITALLDRIQVHHGKDSFRSGGAGMPDGEVTYDQPSGRYTITLQY
jgi:hypothetical protein